MKLRAFLALFATLLWAGVAHAAPYAAFLMTADSGETLYADNADTPLHPASITKMMTLYLAFEAIEDGRLRLADPVVWSRHAASMQPSKLGLRPGQYLSVDETIRAIAVHSANDAAVALGERIDKSEDAFAAHMTRQARELGMMHTHFVNASGLSNREHVTTAHDIAILASSLMKRFPGYYRYFSTPSFTYAGHRYSNHNHLLGHDGIDGIKTGYTVDAGFTLAASAQRDGRRLIAVVFGARSTRDRDADVARLLDLGFTQMADRERGASFNVAANFHPQGAGRPPLLQMETATGDDDEPAPRIRPEPVRDAPVRHATSVRVSHSRHTAPASRPSKKARAKAPDKHEKTSARKTHAKAAAKSTTHSKSKAHTSASTHHSKSAKDSDTHSTKAKSKSKTTTHHSKPPEKKKHKKS